MHERRPRTLAGPRVPGRRRIFALVVMITIGVIACAGAGEPPADPNAVPILHLTNGGYVPGAPRDSDRAGVLRWLSPSFAEPFDFDLGVVQSIQFPAGANGADLGVAPPGPAAAASFELTGGDVFPGTLVELDDRFAVVDSPPLGRLHIRRSQIRRIDRLGDRAALVYLGPNGLGEWRAVTPAGAWRDESGELATEQPKALLRGDLGMPSRAVVEFELTWLKKPDFVLALGVGDDESKDGPASGPGHAFRFEVWDSVIVALCETGDNLVLTPVGKAFPGPGRVHFRAYLDQEQGRLVVTSSEGKTLADLKRPGAAAAPRVPAAGIALGNVHGDVRLERLRIGRWGGAAPPPVQARQACFQRVDGSIVTGQITRFDPASREFVVRDGPREIRVTENEVAGVLLAPEAADDVPLRGVRVATCDGVRLAGELLGVEGDALVLSLAGIQESPRLPVARLRSLVSLRHERPLDPSERTGVLELDGVRLPGGLGEGHAEAGAGASCLAWQPQASTTAGRLREGVSGKIVFREPRPPRPAISVRSTTRLPGGAIEQRVVVQQPDGTLVVQAVTSRNAAGSSGTPLPQARPSIHLRTGDAIPAEVTAIDADGVRFQSPSTRNTFVPHDRIKAVELAPETADAIALGSAERERLLTLPRMQRDAPPTHLVGSRDGDYLRGRLLAMNDATLRVEVRLETMEVPRSRIARIIWLHPDELEPAKEPAKPAPEASGLRVQAVRSDGNRLTFLAEQMRDSTLVGRSEVLGDCRVAIKEVDQLLIGGAIERAAALLTYRQWKLQHAVEPRVAQAQAEGDDAGAGGGRMPGTESALVGKPAPDFELELLAGNKFRLGEAKGRVILLDFWATWCGPCMQAMPQVERVAEEFRERGVQLVAVNLQEAPQQITRTLERHKLHPAVVLDRNGDVAEKYGAHAIPQTVVIDRDGKVARLFVGGGPRLGDQLRDALNAVLGGGEKEPEARP